MEKIRIAIVEDEQKYTDQLKDFLRKYHAYHEVDFDVTEFGDGIDILDDYTAGFDIIFLDINMKNKDGMSTAREIRLIDKEVLIVFITSLAQYAVEGYEVNAFDFILKPISYPIFEPKLSRMMEVMQSRKKNYFLLLEHDGIKEKVSTDDIEFIEVQNHLLLIKTAKYTYEKWGRLKDLEDELSGYNFLKINQSFLVNLKKITSISGNSVFVENTEISISRSHKKEIMENIVQFIEAGF